ncbi:MAG: winged helix-turn-helix transcriptional regulator [Thermococcus sp.]|uniref:ArsR family transcriptional regulator n=1 Tax=Thermococcus litoralis TaxID=2265 RepID=A0A7C0TZT3_THELI|nr:metalloregulator ArsR/SmtB family transcription factor [Thermococcus sp.]OYT33534.1 MAG: transcriptional regulator [Archaeoglobales archaeon ex4484_92]RLF77022.1 MAG: transcriptional regulator [Thermococci archaeon]HDD31846.1 ArsR family transcriptional regulator [Thermococcus litoralis]MCD6139650.1 winged helix-turn-helix transcriptional regulator [Thermococcus sp.]MCD6144333.1 winged helix-turn-helix transcriptional regulator [Thermococcus sp.]
MSNEKGTEVCKVYEEHLDKILEAKKKLPEEELLLDVADFFDALGNPTRLKILFALLEEELCTCDLSNIAGLSVSAISHQLRILKDRKIVAYRKDGKNVFYHLDDEHVKEILNVALKHMEE